MKMKHSVKIACRNIILNRKKSVAVILSLTIALTVCVIVFTYRNLLSERLESTEKEYASVNRIAFSGMEYASGIVAYLNELEGVHEVQYFGRCSFDYLVQLEQQGYFSAEPVYRYLKFTLGNNSYELNQSYGCIDESEPIFVDTYTQETELFTEYEKQEYDIRTSGAELFVCGREPDSIGEIAVPEMVMRSYGIPEEQWEACIGQKFIISWYIPESDMEYMPEEMPTEETVLLSGILSGILSEDIYDITSRGTRYLYVMTEEVSGEMVVFCYPEDYTYKEKIANKVYEKYGIEGTTNSFFEVCEYIGKQIRFVDSVFMAVAAAILLAILVNIFRVYYFISRQRSSFMGMMKAVGYTPGELSGIITNEISIYILASAILAAILGYMGIGALQENVSGILGFSFELNLFAYVKGLIVLLFLSAVFEMLLVFWIRKNILSHQAVELMRCEE